MVGDECARSMNCKNRRGGGAKGWARELCWDVVVSWMNYAWTATIERSRGIIILRTQDKIFAEAASCGVRKFATFVEPCQ